MWIVIAYRSRGLVMNEFLAVQTGEHAAQRLRRKALELADDAAVRLEKLQDDDPKEIHEIRRRFKELRAMVRLVGASRAEGQWFRNAGRRFAAQRDTKAAMEAFDRLRERFAVEWTPRQFLKIRRVLERPAQPTDPLIVSQMRAELAIERGRIAAWPVDSMQPDDLWQAVTRTYRNARRAMRAAMNEGTRERFHEWRRRTKVLWYQEQFIDFLGMADFEAPVKSLRKLQRILGDHHDLVVIDELCRQTPASFGSARYVRRFRGYLARRMRELEENAESTGGELFERRARDWAAGRRRRIGPKKSAVRLPAPSAATA